MELNKTILDLKREVDTIKKTQSEATLEIETLGKKYRTIDVSISNRIQKMEERISGAENSIENITTTIKDNAKCKKILTQNIQGIEDTKIKGSNNYFSLISLNINGLNSPIKRHRLTDWLHEQDPTFCCL